MALSFSMAIATKFELIEELSYYWVVWCWEQSRFDLIELDVSSLETGVDRLCYERYFYWGLHDLFLFQFYECHHGLFTIWCT